MDFMKGMMEKMMGDMSGNQKKEMMGMDGMMNMMGAGDSEDKSFNPMDMCRNMMGAIGKASDLATFATPEIRGLFEEWVIQIEEEIMQFIKTTDQVNPDSIAEHFKLSKASIIYFLTRLAQKGKISLEVKHVNQP